MLFREIKLNGKEYLLIEVPSIKLEFRIHSRYLVMGIDERDVVSKIKKINEGDTKGFYVLPNFDYKVIDTISTLNETKCKELVESINVCDGHFTSKKSHKEYKNYHGGHSYLYAFESFMSYLRSTSLDMTKEYLLLQKNK